MGLKVKACPTAKWAPELALLALLLLELLLLELLLLELLLLELAKATSSSLRSHMPTIDTPRRCSSALRCLMVRGVQDQSKQRKSRPGRTR